MPDVKRGITLVALVITVIILLILAGVSISLVVDSDGLFSKARQASEEWNTAVANEADKISDTMETGDNYTNPEKKALKLLVNSGSDGKVGLPIAVNVSCKIDWGDGNVTTANDNELINTSYKIASVDSLKIASLTPLPAYTHQYNTNNTEYIVTITGIRATESLCDGYTPEKIIKILQWGNMKLEYIDFLNCTNLESIVSPTSLSFKNSSDFSICFGNCTSLSSIPSDLFKYCTNMQSLYGAFSGCTSLSSIPTDLFKYCTNVTDFGAVFCECTSLSSIPSNLFEQCTNVKYFYDAFAGCTNLTGQAIPLWERMENGATYNYEPEFDSNNDIIRKPDGFGCYCDCTGLTNYSSIPEYWKSPPDLR